MAKIWLIFLRDQAALFNRTVKLIEKDTISAPEVGSALHYFVDSLENRKIHFLSMAVQNEIERASEPNQTVTKEQVPLKTTEFYDTCIEYIKGWIYHSDDTVHFRWIELRHLLERSDVLRSAKLIAKRNRFDMEARDVDLFDQFGYLTKYVTAEKIQEWNHNETTIDQRRFEIFSHLSEKQIPHYEVLDIVSYIPCLPGTSACVERIFSLINDMWSPEKSQLSINTLLDLLYVCALQHQFDMHGIP